KSPRSSKRSACSSAGRTSLLGTGDGACLSMGGKTANFTRGRVARSLAQTRGYQPTMGRPEKIRLGDALVAQKLISQEQLKQALDTQKKVGRRLGRVLIDQGILTEDNIAEALGKQLGLPFINLKYYDFNKSVSSRLPEQAARRFRAIALEDRGRSFLVGMSDPTDLFAFDELTRILRKEIEAAVISESQALQTIDQ